MKKESNPHPPIGIVKPTPSPAPPKAKYRHVCGMRYEKIESTWKDQPTTDGYYWFKSNEFGTEIVEVINFPDMPLVMEIGTSERSSTDSTSGKWYGPITPPKED